MSSNRKLSKSILEMKFMKRTKEKVEKEEEIEETKKMYHRNMKMSSDISNYFFEPSYFLCEELKEGRLSFRGMNKELEEYLQKSNYFETTKTERPKQEVEVEDGEMAVHYNMMKSNTKTDDIIMQKLNRIRKNNNFDNRKRKGNFNHPNNKGKKFMRPNDD